ncbi:MAG: ribonuclease E activity regulator RraA [Candidatus Eremiobacteraeota bacterium]|nr:ribonuclease E activity regulator RraA [Candidatus Eremiobacteraeota bacterium]
MIATADLCDREDLDLQVAYPIFHDYGGVPGFCGPISTIKCHEDNSLVVQAVSEPGQGRVLVVDGGGSLRCALLGDRLAGLAKDNGWAGLIIFGAVRDTRILKTIQVGIKALASMPRKSIKRDEGQRDVLLRMAGVEFTPGAQVYADEDGVVVTPTAVTA